MAEPFVFYFTPDALGRPNVMYIADARVECGLCRHPQLQRFYHSTPFHTVGVAQWHRLLLEIPSKAGYECENCGEQVGPEGVVASTLTYGFPDESGLIVGFLSNGESSWTFEPNRRLDPQRLPVFKGDTVPDLDEDIIEQTFARVSSPKMALLELLEDEAPGFVQASSDMVWVMCDEDELDDLLDEIESTSEFQDPVFVSLDDSEPDEIGTHVDFLRMTGRWSQWLPPRFQAMMPEHVVGALVDGEHAAGIFARVLEVARLESECLDDGDWRVWTSIRTPGGIEFPRSVSLQSILRRAVFTGITPGESARLTGEELAGLLLRVWKTESK